MREGYIANYQLINSPNAITSCHGVSYKFAISYQVETIANIPNYTASGNTKIKMN